MGGGARQILPFDSGCALFYGLVFSGEMPLEEDYVSMRKRQIEGPDFVCTSFDNCGDHNFVGVTLEELNFTQEQRDMCNNDDSCLFDLAVTGDEEFANTTLEASEENTKVQELISKK